MRLLWILVFLVVGCVPEPRTSDQIIERARREMTHIYRQTPDLLTSRLMAPSQIGTTYSEREIHSIASRCDPSEFTFDAENSTVEVGRSINRVFFICEQTDYLVIFQQYIVVNLSAPGRYNSFLVCRIDDCENYPDKHLYFG